MTVVGLDRAETERKQSADVINELDGVGLGVTPVDLQGSNSRSVIDGRELIALDGAREGEKLTSICTWCPGTCFSHRFTTCLAMMVRLMTVLGSRLTPCRERVPRTPPSEISTPW